MYKIKLKENISRMLLCFRKSASLHSLSLISQEVFHNKIIGLDKDKKKLLIIESNGLEYESKFIDLTEVKTCRLKRIYHAIKADGFRNRKLNDYLSAVTLEFHFINNKHPFVLDFYKTQSNFIYKTIDLEKKARKWETVVSSIITPLQTKPIKIPA